MSELKINIAHSIAGYIKETDENNIESLARTNMQVLIAIRELLFRTQPQPKGFLDFIRFWK